MLWAPTATAWPKRAKLWWTSSIHHREVCGKLTFLFLKACLARYPRQAAWNKVIFLLVWTSRCSSSLDRVPALKNTCHRGGIDAKPSQPLLCVGGFNKHEFSEENLSKICFFSINVSWIFIHIFLSFIFHSYKEGNVVLPWWENWIVLTGPGWAFNGCSHPLVCKCVLEWVTDQALLSTFRVHKNNIWVESF